MGSITVTLSISTQEFARCYLHCKRRSLSSVSCKCAETISNSQWRLRWVWDIFL